MSQNSKQVINNNAEKPQDKEKEKKDCSISRFNLLFIYHVLQRYSDDEHPLTASQIMELVNKNYSQFNQGEPLLTASTVKRSLEYVLAGPRFNIVECVKKGNVYKAYNPQKHVQETKYFYMEHDFETSEIRTLIDAIDTYSYFSEDEVTELITKLKLLKPSALGSAPFVDKAAKLRHVDSMLLNNIGELGEIIKHGKCAELDYCHYNEKKELVSRRGYPKVVEPVAMMWSNGYYYLVAYHPEHKTLANFRIDRIREVIEVEEKISYDKSKFNPVEYRQEHPVMYSGKTEHFHMLCKLGNQDYIINTLIDTFGKDINIRPVTDKLLNEHLNKSLKECKEAGEKWVHVTTDATEGGIILFALQYGDICRVIEPAATVEKLRERIEKARVLYK